MKSSMLKFLIISLMMATATADARTRQGRTGEASHIEEEVVEYTGPIGQHGGTLVLPCVGQPHTLNPVLASESSSRRILEFTSAAMLGYDCSEQRLDEGLVRTYTSSDDGLVWTFAMRRGVRWSDGHPFDVDDILFTYRVYFDPEIDNDLSSSFAQSDRSYPRVEKVNSFTVRFTLKERNALFLDNVSAVSLLPRHSLEAAYKRGEFHRILSFDTAPGSVVGLGPFRLKEIVVQGDQTDRIVLERNPYYWKKDRAGRRLPYLDEVSFHIVPDQNSAVALFQNGVTDFLIARPGEIDLLEREKAKGAFTIHDLGPGLNVTYLLFNRADPRPSDSGGLSPLNVARRNWFSNDKFRQSISHAINRERIANLVFSGRAASVFAFTTPASKHWYDAASFRRYPYDLQISRLLLKEIGIEDRNGDGLLEDTKGNRIAFTIRTNQNNPIRVETALRIAEDLKELGILVTVEPVTFNAMVDMLQSTQDYDAVIGGWVTGIPPDPILLKNIVMSNGVLHYGRPHQPKPATPWEGKIDELMRENERTLDMTVRKNQFSDVMRLWSEHLPEIDLVASHHIVAVRNRVGNLRPAFIGEGAWNVDELFIRGPAVKAPAGSNP